MEMKLSEGMPEIGRVIGTWGQVLLRSKEWRSSAVGLSGGVLVWVLYAPEDGSVPRCVEGWLPFQMDWDLREDVPDGTMRIQSYLRNADARVISARKLMVRAGVSVLCEAYCDGSAAVSVPDRLPEDVQLLRETYPMMIEKEAGEKAFTLEEDLSVSSGAAPKKLLYYSLQPQLSESRVSGSKVVFRGNARLHGMYRGSDGTLGSFDQDIPFSQLGDLAQTYTPDAQTDVMLAVTDLDVDLDGDGNMHCKCSLAGQYTVSQREMVELVTDAYSPVRSVHPEVTTLELPSQLENRRESVHAEQILPQDAVVVLDAAFLPEHPRVRWEPEGVRVENAGQFQILYQGPDELLQTGNVRWEGEMRLPAQENVSVDATVREILPVQAIIGNGGISLRCDTSLQLRSVGNGGIQMVTGLDMEEIPQTQPTRPSIIVRRVGTDRLWDIAKASASTVDAIRQANGLAEEPTADQILLIPVG